MTSPNDTDPQPTPDNVVPPNELEHRRRVLACIEDLADFAGDIVDRIRELRAMGVPATDWMPLLADHAPQAVQALYQRYGGFVASTVDGFLDARAAGAKSGIEGVMAALAGSVSRGASSPPLWAAVDAPEGARVSMPEDLSREEFHSFETLRMRRVIGRLFAEAPKMTDAAGKPDLTQAPALECHVMLKSGGAIQGALSVTPEGTLRMMAPNQVGKKPVMVEHFFDYEQVADIAVFREVKASEGSRIVTS